jgi:hypothetical protein
VSDDPYFSNRRERLVTLSADAFTKAGWIEVIFSEGGGLGIGVSTGRGNGMALTLKRAIEASTKFKVASFGPDEPDNPGIVFVGVGTNPAEGQKRDSLVK